MALFQELEKQGTKLFKYRGSLPVLVLIIALITFSYEQYNLYKNAILNEGYYSMSLLKWLSLLVALTGLTIRIHTLGFAKPHTSGRNTTKQIADDLNTTGMYSIVRHPLYLGNFLMWLGVGMLTQNLYFISIFMLAFWLYYERIMFAEESYLIKKFGENYLLWANATPAFLPKLSKWEKPNLNFAWKKVIRQEKSGIAALFTVFMIFHQIEYYIPNETIDWSLNVWNVLFLIFGIYLITVKIIQKNTTLLNREITR